MSRLAFILLIPVFCLAAPVKQQWLTKEQIAQLSAITSRPYITAKRPLGKGVEELRWTNGSREWVTTQAVTRVLGAKAANGWQKKIDAKEREKQNLLDDIRALGKKAKVTPSEINAVADRHDPGRAGLRAGGK